MNKNNKKKETFVTNVSIKGRKIMKKENILLECQKEFLFNSEYGYNELHPNYKSLRYHCKRSDLREEIDIEEITKSELTILTKNVFEAISVYCENCRYRSKKNQLGHN